MKKIKKTLKLLGYIVLIVLGSIGIGIAGGAPIPVINRKKDKIEYLVELDESSTKEDSEFDELEIKQ